MISEFDNETEMLGQGNIGTRPDFENMSDSEREQMMEEFQQRRSESGGQGAGMAMVNSQSVTRVSGEILSISNGTLTLKLTDSGSKFIFLPSSVKVYEPKTE